MTKTEFKKIEKRFQILEEEICYLRKAIELIYEQKPVEVHYHYTIDNRTLTEE